MFRHTPNQTNLPILGLLLGIALLGGLYGASQFRIPGGPSAIYAAENTYAIALDGALTYRKLCVAHTLPASCRATYARIQSADRVAGAAYDAIKGHELDATPALASAFLSAVSNLKAAVPAVAGAQ